MVLSNHLFFVLKSIFLSAFHFFLLADELHLIYLLKIETVGLINMILNFDNQKYVSIESMKIMKNIAKIISGLKQQKKPQVFRNTYLNFKYILYNKKRN